MANKKKRKSEWAKAGTTKYSKKQIYSVNYHKNYTALRKSQTFKKPVFETGRKIKSKETLSDALDKHIFPLWEANDERRSKKYGRGRPRTFRVHLKYKLRNKTIKTAFSISRTIAKDLKGFKERFKEKILEKMRQYLLRKDLKSIAITGYSEEVLIAPKKKGNKRATRSKTVKK